MPLSILFALFLLLVSFSDGNASGINYADSIIVGGLKRTYLIHIPPSYDKNKSMPLVIALHGGGGSAKDMVKLTKGGFNRLADKEGFIVVYPEGAEHKWNDGRDERFSQADDVGFISALIEHLARSINIDRTRIYATGVSNGAHMSMRLARELSNKIAAVAPVAYSMQKKYEQVPVSAKPVSFLIITGTNDPLIPWRGGNTPWPTERRMLGEILSVPQTVGVLVSHNQCSTTPAITYEPDKDPQDGTRVRKEVYENGKDGTEVILYAIEGGGHTWPGGFSFSRGALGKISRDIDANEVIWDFFKKHARDIIETDRFGLHAVWNRTQDVKNLGITLIRGIYHFDVESVLKKWLKKYQDDGMNIVLTVIPTSKKWGNAVVNSFDLSKIPGGEGICGFPSDVEAYKRKLAALIEGIDGDGKDDYKELKYPVKYVQLANEPFWQWYGNPPSFLKSPQEVQLWRENNLDKVWENFGEYIKISYQTIKAANPEMTVVLGAVIDDPDRTDNKYAKKVLEDYRDYYDVIDVHSYGNYVELGRNLEAVKSILSPDKPVWSLEIGGHMRKDPFDTAGEFKRHAEEVVKMQVVAFEKGIDKIFWSSLVPTIGWPQSFLNTALLEVNTFSKKPAYYTYKILNDKINYFKSVTRIIHDEYFYRFEFENKNPVFILWSKSVERTVDMSNYINTPSVKVTHIITEIGDTDTDDATETVSTKSVKISEAPIFVEEIVGKTSKDIDANEVIWNFFKKHVR